MGRIQYLNPNEEWDFQKGIRDDAAQRSNVVNAGETGAEAFQQAQSNAVANGLIPGGDTIGNGVLGHAKDAADAGWFNMWGGTARFLGEFTGSDYLNKKATDWEQRAAYNTAQQPLEGADWWANAVGNAVGSGGAAMAEAAIVSGIAAALGVAVGAGAGAAGIGGAVGAAYKARGALAAGRAVGAATWNVIQKTPALGRLAKCAEGMWNSSYGKMLIGQVAGSPFEGMAEAGNLITEMRNEGYSDDEIRASALKSAAYNTAWLTVCNMLEAGVGSKIAGRVGKVSDFGKAMKNGLSPMQIAGRVGTGAVSDAVGEGVEEMGQEAIGTWAKDGFGAPLDYDQIIEAGKMGAAGGLFLGGAGQGIDMFSNRNARDFYYDGSHYEASAPYNVDGETVRDYSIDGRNALGYEVYNKMGENTEQGRKSIGKASLDVKLDNSYKALNDIYKAYDGSNIENVNIKEVTDALFNGNPDDVMKVADKYSEASKKAKDIIYNKNIDDEVSADSETVESAGNYFTTIEDAKKFIKDYVNNNPEQEAYRDYYNDILANADDQEIIYKANSLRKEEMAKQQAVKADSNPIAQPTEQTNVRKDTITPITNNQEQVKDNYVRGVSYPRDVKDANIYARKTQEGLINSVKKGAISIDEAKAQNDEIIGRMLNDGLLNENQAKDRKVLFDYRSKGYDIIANNDSNYVLTQLDDRRKQLIADYEAGKIDENSAKIGYEDDLRRANHLLSKIGKNKRSNLRTYLSNALTRAASKKHNQEVSEQKKAESAKKAAEREARRNIKTDPETKANLQAEFNSQIDRMSKEDLDWLNTANNFKAKLDQAFNDGKLSKDDRNNLYSEFQKKLSDAQKSRREKETAARKAKRDAENAEKKQSTTFNNGKKKTFQDRINSLEPQSQQKKALQQILDVAEMHYKNYLDGGLDIDEFNRVLDITVDDISKDNKLTISNIKKLLHDEFFNRIKAKEKEEQAKKDAEAKELKSKDVTARKEVIPILNDVITKFIKEQNYTKEDAIKDINEAIDSKENLLDESKEQLKKNYLERLDNAKKSQPKVKEETTATKTKEKEVVEKKVVSKVGEISSPNDLPKSLHGFELKQSVIRVNGKMLPYYNYGNVYINPTEENGVYIVCNEDDDPIVSGSFTLGEAVDVTERILNGEKFEVGDTNPIVVEKPNPPTTAKTVKPPTKSKKNTTVEENGKDKKDDTKPVGDKEETKKKTEEEKARLKAEKEAQKKAEEEAKQKAKVENADKSSAESITNGRTPSQKLAKISTINGLKTKCDAFFAKGSKGQDILNDYEDSLSSSIEDAIKKANALVDEIVEDIFPETRKALKEYFNSELERLQKERQASLEAEAKAKAEEAKKKEELNAEKLRKAEQAKAKAEAEAKAKAKAKAEADAKAEKAAKVKKELEHINSVKAEALTIANGDKTQPRPNSVLRIIGEMINRWENGKDNKNYLEYQLKDDKGNEFPVISILKEACKNAKEVTVTIKKDADSKSVMHINYGLDGMNNLADALLNTIKPDSNEAEAEAKAKAEAEARLLNELFPENQEDDVENQTENFSWETAGVQDVADYISERGAELEETDETATKEDTAKIQKFYDSLQQGDRVEFLKSLKANVLNILNADLKNKNIQDAVTNLEKAMSDALTRYGIPEFMHDYFMDISQELCRILRRGDTLSSEDVKLNTKYVKITKDAPKATIKADKSLNTGNKAQPIKTDRKPLKNQFKPAPQQVNQEATQQGENKTANNKQNAPKVDKKSYEEKVEAVGKLLKKGLDIAKDGSNLKHALKGIQSILANIVKGKEQLYYQNKIKRDADGKTTSSPEYEWLALTALRSAVNDLITTDEDGDLYIKNSAVKTYANKVRMLEAMEKFAQDMIDSEQKKTQARSRTDSSLRSKQEIVDEIASRLVKGAKITKVDNEHYQITFPNSDKVVTLNIPEHTMVNSELENQAKKSHNLSGPIEVLGYWQSVSGGAIRGVLNLSQASELGDGGHEVIHMVLDLFATDREKQAIFNHAKRAQKLTRNKLDTEEYLVDRILNYEENDKTYFGKFINKIKDILGKLEALLTGDENPYDVYRKVLNKETQNRSMNEAEKSSAKSQSVGVKNLNNKTKWGKQKLDDLEKAKKMSAENKTMEEIFDQTGWWQGKDKQWRFQILDNPEGVDVEKIKNELADAGEEGLDIKDVYNNEELWNLYAGKNGVLEINGKPLRVAEMEQYEVDEGYYGSYDNEENIIYINSALSDDEIKTSIAHELQHAIQEYEDFAKGVNPDEAPRRTVYYIDKLKKEGRPKDSEKLGKAFDKLAILLDSIQHGVLTEKQLRKKQELFEKGIEKLPANKREEIEKTFDQIRYLTDNVMFGNNCELYQMFYGEQEARQTENQMEILNSDLSEKQKADLLRNNVLYGIEGDSIVDMGETKFLAIGKKGAEQIRGKNALINLKAAEAMDELGFIVPQDIFVRTGWYKARDGKWRCWLDDGDKVINFDKIKNLFYSTIGTALKLVDIIDNPALFEAYPELAKVSFSFMEDDESTLACTDGKTYLKLNISEGGFVPDNNTVVLNNDKYGLIYFDTTHKKIYQANTQKVLFDCNKSYPLFSDAINKLKNGQKPGSGVRFAAMMSEAIFDEAFEIYKDFKNSVIVEKEAKPLYNPDSEDIINSIYHEVQHLIQDTEGFASGGSSIGVSKNILSQLNKDSVIFSKKYNDTVFNEITEKIQTLYKNKLVDTTTDNSEQSFIDRKNEIVELYYKIQQDYSANHTNGNEIRNFLDLVETIVDIINSDNEYVMWEKMHKAYGDLHGEQEARLAAEAAVDGVDTKTESGKREIYLRMKNSIGHSNVVFDDNINSSSANKTKFLAKSVDERLADSVHTPSTEDAWDDYQQNGKGNFKSWVSEKLKTAWDDFYRNWVDKNTDLHKIDKRIADLVGKAVKQSDKIYNNVSRIVYTATGIAESLITGDVNHLKAINAHLKNRKLKHMVTLQTVVDHIKEDKLNADSKAFMGKYKCKTSYQALDKVLAWLRLKEMAKLRRETWEQEHKAWAERKARRDEWEARGKRDKNGKPCNEPTHHHHEEWLSAKSKWDREHYIWKNNGAKGTDPRIALQKAWLAKCKAEGFEESIYEPVATVGQEPKFEPYKMPEELTEVELNNAIKTIPQQFKDAARDYYKVNDNLLTIMEDAGLIDKETHDYLNTKYKFYCPLMRDYSDTQGVENFLANLDGASRSMVNAGSTLQKIKVEGSDKTVIGPLASTIKAIALITNRAERNKAGQHFIKTCTDLGNIKEGDPMYDVCHLAEDQTKGADPKKSTFYVMENGEKVLYQTSPEFYQPIKGYDVPAADLFTGIMHTFSSTLRNMATNNPSFVVRNGFRDTVWAGINSKNGFIPILGSIHGAKLLRTRPDLVAKAESLGLFSFTNHNSEGEIVTSLNEMTKGKVLDYSDPYKLVKSFVKYKVWDKLTGLSEFVENATRLEEFYLALQNGKSVEDAVEDAKDVTTNFGRMGIKGEKANQSIAFFNAAIQGGDSFVRAFIDRPYHTMAMIATTILLPTFGLWLLNKDEDWYKEMDPGIKYSHWCLPEGFRVNLPQEAGLFGGALMALLDSWYEDDPKAIDNMATNAIGMIAPNVVPTVFLPILEWQANYSFFTHRNIVSKRLEKLPDEMQYDNGTSETAKAIGSVAGVSPKKVDNLVRGYLASMGGYIMHAPDIIAADAGNYPEKKMNELPLARDFSVTDSIRSKYVNYFYEISDNAQKQHNAYGVKGKPSVDVQAITSAGRKIAEIRKEIREITDPSNTRISPARKRQLQEDRERKINGICKAIVNKYGDKYLA